MWPHGWRLWLKPGGIFISSAVFDQVRGRLPFGFTYLGAQHVKNISHPIKVYEVRFRDDPRHRRWLSWLRYRRRQWTIALVGIVLTVAILSALASVAWRENAPSALPAVNPSIAVLPFSNLSGDPKQNF